MRQESSWYVASIVGLLLFVFGQLSVAQTQIKGLPVEVVATAAEYVPYTKGPSVFDKLQTAPSSHTSCTGNSSYFGQFSQANLDCSTVSSQSGQTREPFVEYREVDYTVVKSDQALYLFSCNELTHGAWKKCPILLTGAKYILTTDNSGVLINGSSQA
jgi:hypothetical protein